MTDLCSGSGEPAISIFRKSHCFSTLTLSDKYPGVVKFEEDDIYYNKLSIDILEMEFQPNTVYTIFNAFHHFSNEDKIKIVQKMKLSGSEAFIVEILEPTFLCLLKVIFATTIGVLLLTPFIYPFSFKRLFYTYILPINLFTISFDGILSVLKSLSLKHYERLFAHQQDRLNLYQLKSGFNTLTVIQIESGK